jgi:hypothetical protein
MNYKMKRNERVCIHGRKDLKKDCSSIKGSSVDQAQLIKLTLAPNSSSEKRDCVSISVAVAHNKWLLKCGVFYN